MASWRWFSLFDRLTKQRCRSARLPFLHDTAGVWRHRDDDIAMTKQERGRERGEASCPPSSTDRCVHIAGNQRWRSTGRASADRGQRNAKRRMHREREREREIERARERKSWSVCVCSEVCPRPSTLLSRQQSVRPQGRGAPEQPIQCSSRRQSVRTTHHFASSCLVPRVLSFDPSRTSVRRECC